jgi:hypothetical protein
MMKTRTDRVVAAETPHKAYDLVRLGTSKVVGGSGSGLQSFRVKSFAAGDGDHLVCRTWNGQTSVEGTVDVLVAKPERLRLRPYHNQTVNGVRYVYDTPTQRTATQGDISEVQIVVPPYYVNQVIRAASPIKGTTGVRTPAPGTGMIAWEEVSARDWAAVTESTTGGTGGASSGSTQNNLGSDRNPIATDDITAGYSITSLWANIAADTLWGCLDDAPGAAVWKQLDSAGAATPVSLARTFAMMGA